MDNTLDKIQSWEKKLKKCTYDEGTQEVLADMCAYLAAKDEIINELKHNPHRKDDK